MKNINRQLFDAFTDDQKNTLINSLNYYVFINIMKGEMSPEEINKYIVDHHSNISLFTFQSYKFVPTEQYPHVIECVESRLLYIPEENKNNYNFVAPTDEERNKFKIENIKATSDYIGNCTYKLTNPTDIPIIKRSVTTFTE